MEEVAESVAAAAAAEEEEEEEEEGEYVAAAGKRTSVLGSLVEVTSFSVLDFGFPFLDAEEAEEAAAAEEEEEEDEEEDVAAAEERTPAFDFLYNGTTTSRSTIATKSTPLL